MRPSGVGFSPTGNDYMRLAQKAEEFGYNSIWVGDHIVVPEKIEAALSVYARWISRF